MKDNVEIWKINFLSHKGKNESDIDYEVNGFEGI